MQMRNCVFLKSVNLTKRAPYNSEWYFLFILFSSFKLLLWMLFATWKADTKNDFPIDVSVPLPGSEGSFLSPPEFSIRSRLQLRLLSQIVLFGSSNNQHTPSDMNEEQNKSHRAAWKIGLKWWRLCLLFLGVWYKKKENGEMVAFPILFVYFFIIPLISTNKTCFQLQTS